MFANAFACVGSAAGLPSVAAVPLSGDYGIAALVVLLAVALGFIVADGLGHAARTGDAVPRRPRRRPPHVVLVRSKAHLA